MEKLFKRLIHKGNIYVLKKQLGRRNLIHRVLLENEKYLVAVYVKSRTYNFRGTSAKHLIVEIDNFLLNL